ncbi:hypothetical protein JP33_07370 [Gallibacterium anatis CCM5995]|uniref:helix-turn-helix domain-containing protein n=1 Tax=Gallibacterium anatis TaxID=750 RepID=UPI000531CE0E|nr:helix-turn-helix domain-containing protein [Gallibacterium anatis]KGQ25081.1 hypothetical protein JP33_07370 [Gallibacterium anatis CCM5995]
MKNPIEINSSEIVDRMKKISNVFQDKELAEILGLTAASIVSWKKRNTIPLENLIKISNQFNVSVDFLLWGEQTKQLSTQEKMALIAFNDLDERGKVDAIAYMSGIKNKVASISQTVQGSSNNVVGNGNIHIVGKE